MATNGDTDTGTVPVSVEEATFHEKQKVRLKEIEKKIEEEAKKKRREWEKEVDRMRTEFLTLYPKDRKWGSDELLEDPMVYKRRGSTDILDSKKMKTMFTESPYTGCKFRLLFDVQNYERESIKVSMENDTICVWAIRMEEDDNGEMKEREYYRKIQKPNEVDSEKMHCTLTKDQVLILDAALPPHTLNFQRKISSSPSHSTHSCSSSRSRSPSNSPRSPNSNINVAINKPGQPVFGGQPAERRMNLVVDIGKFFKPREITIQVVNSSRIQVRAKHEERSAERFTKNKYQKEWELTEKIEAYTMRGGLTEDGKLIVGALGKEHDAVKNGPVGQELWDELASTTTPCNVLDLASFPAAPSTPT